jgi:3-hydroxyisobutyrate dehydrogenase-like beta-hydroxyacid dehydrogenase
LDKAGLIGAGRMGRAMVKHLLARGFTVTVTDTSRDACAAAEALGAAEAATPAEVAAAADVVFIAVGFDREVIEVCRGERGLLATAPAGKVIVVNSTISPKPPLEVSPSWTHRSRAGRAPPMPARCLPW